MTRSYEHWGAGAPSIHDSTVLALRTSPGHVELDVELDEEHAWATLQLVFALIGDRDHSWDALESLLAAGAEPELMVISFIEGEAHLGISVEPEVNGVRWLDVTERVSDVLYSMER